ncbi:MAG: type II toxin-antitoxin system RelE/ParE family toxin [Acidimicrobiaceae bacterium]|nr:type II toxin-antitoxin system RelE/ParE family toxin [Acidimicrobiaceae bacterium]
MYRARITPEAMRNIGHLPDKVRHAAMATITGPLTENPRRLGKSLGGEFEGLWSARLVDYRIIYAIMEEDSVVMIHRIQHRRHVYRPN